MMHAFLRPVPTVNSNQIIVITISWNLPDAVDRHDAIVQE